MFLGQSRSSLNRLSEENSHCLSMQAAVNQMRFSLNRKKNDKTQLALYEKAVTVVDSTESIDLPKLL